MTKRNALLTIAAVLALSSLVACGSEICNAAAKVAYQGDINSIRVTGQSGKELAQGIAGAGCS